MNNKNYDIYVFYLIIKSIKEALSCIKRYLNIVSEYLKTKLCRMSFVKINRKSYIFDIYILYNNIKIYETLNTKNYD